MSVHAHSTTDLALPLTAEATALPLPGRQRRIVGWIAAWTTGLLLLTGAFVQYAFIAPTAAEARLYTAQRFERQLIVLANQTRYQQGLSALVVDDRLTAAAAAKARDMISRGYFGHFYQGGTPWAFIDAAGYTDWKWAGENLAKNYRSPDQMMQAWLDSPSHRDNLLSNQFDRTGIATVAGKTPAGESVTVTVQLFAGS